MRLALLFLFVFAAQANAAAPAAGKCFACPAYDVGQKKEGLIGDGFATTETVARQRALAACNSDRVDYPARRCQLGACGVMSVKPWETCGDGIPDGKGNTCDTYWTGHDWQKSCQAIPSEGGPRGYCKGGGDFGMCSNGDVCCPAFGCSDGSACH